MDAMDAEAESLFNAMSMPGDSLLDNLNRRLNFHGSVPELSSPFQQFHQNSLPRMNGNTRVVPVTILGAPSHSPRGAVDREAVSPSLSRKFDSLPRHMPSHQMQPQFVGLNSLHPGNQGGQTMRRSPTPQQNQPPRQPTPNPQQNLQQNLQQNQQSNQQQNQQQSQQQNAQQNQQENQNQDQQQNAHQNLQQNQQQQPTRNPPSDPESPTTDTQRSARVPMLQRKTSIDDFNEKIVNLLDDVERRVEQFRETASQLESEKEQILEMLNNVNLNTEILRLGEGEREDINAITNRLLSRTKTVDVVVNTPRNPEQAKALESVNGLIEGVLNKLQEDLSNGKETCRRYLNACSPDQPEGPIDQRFQAQIIECTADDQKKIRRKLAQLIQQIERSERTCFPQY